MRGAAVRKPRGLKTRRELRTADPIHAYWPQFAALAETDGRVLLLMVLHMKDKGMMRRATTAESQRLYTLLLASTEEGERVEEKQFIDTLSRDYPRSEEARSSRGLVDYAIPWIGAYQDPRGRGSGAPDVGKAGSLPGASPRPYLDRGSAPAPEESRMSPKPTRRAFTLGGVALTARASLPALAPPAFEPVRVGVIGPGKRGMTLMRNAFLREGYQVTAVCEVDASRLAAAKGLADERQGGDCFATTRHEELLSRGDVDAVVIATPDHWHAHQILDSAAAGKHIYCEKPLTLTLREAQRVVPAVQRAGVVFQTGSQQRTEFGRRFVDACELVRAGRIGEVLTVHVGVGDPHRACDLPAEEHEPGLDWDRWLGPAPERPYHSDLSPRGVHGHYPAWRRYWEYAGGGLADMGAHHFDIAMWGLGRDGDGPVEVHPPEDPSSNRGASVVFEDGVRLVHGGPSGTTFVGTGGIIHVDRGRISSTPGNLLTDPLPEDAPLLPRHPSHAADWLQAIRGEGSTTCPVEVGAGSVAICHLMNLAYRHRRSLGWDPVTWRFDESDANAWLDVERRADYALPQEW